ncbi:hypothetical protein E3Q18_00039 [Wallemia mellicola]|uniref:RING-type E3 ubiquitin transferase (cysteine targeting) n=1 Tax=Wallemia mellicola TaxID=1708541 RepID=A0A4T0M9I2_9BASI|nr:hypothetical protein E3Q23_00037 [Wallemia mellicola]TIB94853.1 hypothetical protein E3Q19_00227 [Wallemia mellicola]TIC03783.1 hypothetical protein E3Q18_00039 [Wallemia mellicola]TIC11057.1 hypothetical protein E3Q14_02492 [Wallemia mellicola]TIC32337.1 hypothetical protein E3Q11_00518 [Wallemia mellicola]
MRVQRLDGLELDDEVVRRITQPIIDASSLLGISTRDEIIAAIKGVYMWKYLNIFQSIYGMDLQLLKYTNLSTTKSILYLISRILIPFGHKKLKSTIETQEWRSLHRHHLKKQVVRIVDRLETLYDIANIGNHISFISGGNFANLTERALSLNVSGGGTTNVNLEFTQRQLVWSVMTVCIIISSDFTNMEQEFLHSIITSRSTLQSRQTADIPLGDGVESCVVCANKNITVAYSPSCGHKYDYSCLINLIKSYTSCSVCKSKILSIDRV